MFSHVNSCFRLPVPFDIDKLLADLEICLDRSWKEHYNQKDYSGKWQAISLRSQTGSADDVMAYNSDSSFKDTSLLKECTNFSNLLGGMHFEKESIRLLRLASGSMIKTHRDHGLAYRFNTFRLHIPIVTDAEVEFMIGDRHVEMKQGECWYADFDLPHSVCNNSLQDRIHLIIDGKRNAWTDKLFAAAGYDFSEEKRMLDYSVETKKQMISHLRLMKTSAAEAIIRKLENEIGHAEK